jgi:predicted site-specific integrase-resolvase
MQQKYIKLSEYAREKSITYKTAWNHFKKNLIPNAFIDQTGHVYIPINTNNILTNKRAVIYARVSSNDRKESLINQQKRLEEFAILKNYRIISSHKEIASGMNDNRTILNNILKNNNSWDVLLVENKDRLTRFGFNYIKQLLENQNKTIIVINQTDDDNNDLMKDLISIIYSFSARMYGLRRRKNKKDIIEFLNTQK